MIYVMSDIHGNARRFRSVIKQIDLQPEDTLYVLGDVIDRYPDGIKILRWIMSMPNAKMLLGNHEYMMLNVIDPKSDSNRDAFRDMKLWYRNHGLVTHEYLKRIRKSVRQEIIGYLNNLPLNIDVEVNGKRYLLVHGSPVELYSEYDYRYNSPTEFAVWHRLECAERSAAGKTIVFGHTPTSHYQNNNPLEIWHSRGGDQIGIDCGCGYPPAEEQISHPVYGRLACLRLDDMKVFYSEEEIPEKVEEVLW